MFIESSSFAVSALAGTATVKAGMATLSLIMVATPIGWVGLIVGGIAVAGTAAAASLGANHIVKQDAGSIYDSIMKFVEAL